MYSSFLYSIYISTEPIYTSPIYPPARIVIFIPISFSALSGPFLFFGQPISPYQKKFLRKKTCQKKIFLFLRKKFYFFGSPLRKKIIFYIAKIFFPPYILLRSVKTLTVGISESRQNKLVRWEYIYSACGTRGQRIWGVQEIWNVQRNWGVQINWDVQRI